MVNEMITAFRLPSVSQLAIHASPREIAHTVALVKVDIVEKDERRSNNFEI
jgi:hypothetical protein